MIKYLRAPLTPSARNINYLKTSSYVTFANAYARSAHVKTNWTLYVYTYDMYI